MHPEVQVTIWQYVINRTDIASMWMWLHIHVIYIGKKITTDIISGDIIFVRLFVPDQAWSREGTHIICLV